MSNVPVGRAIDGEPITIYDSGTRSWTVIHVVDVARAFMDSFERLEEHLEVCETGVTTSPISSDEDQSVGAIAETVQQITMTDDPESAVELLEN
jgi:nucleoside-diphosphate-sugar epimerase